MEVNKKSLYGAPAAEEVFIAPPSHAADSRKAAGAGDPAREARIARRVRCIKATGKIPGHARRAEGGGARTKEPARRARV